MLVIFNVHFVLCLAIYDILYSSIIILDLSSTIIYGHSDHDHNRFHQYIKHNRNSGNDNNNNNGDNSDNNGNNCFFFIVMLLSHQRFICMNRQF